VPNRRPPKSPPPRDPIEAQAEEDVARLRDLLKSTKAEVARGKLLVERIESRKKLKD
jgi:hypothetical protein